MRTSLLIPLTERLKLPHTDLRQLSFCASPHPGSVSEWCESLPTGKPTSTSILLYQALPEICRLDTTPEIRMEILETLRPITHQCLEALSTKFLEQPLAMSEQSMKIAVIAQALQKHLSNGYCQVVRGLAHRYTEGTPRKSEQRQMVIALHRAISSIGQQYLRHSLLYVSAPSQLWLELNTLYLLAERTGLLHTDCTDTLLANRYRSTVQGAYLRVILLACANPNELRQEEIRRLYKVLCSWSSLCRLYPLSRPTEELFVIDTLDAHPPSYRSQWLQNNPPVSLRSIKLSALVTALSEYGVDRDSGVQLDIPSFISPRLIQHLIHKWGAEQLRLDARDGGEGTLETLTGFTPVHYHLSAKKTLEEFLQHCGTNQTERNRFEVKELDSGIDPWATAHDAEVMSKSHFDVEFEYEDEATVPQTPDLSTRYPSGQARIVDSSARGFCLEWMEASPQPPKTGELIAVRQSRSAPWTLGVIRWIKQHLNASQIGIELIAYECTPVGLKQRLKSGNDSDFMRGFIGQPISDETPNSTVLITAAIPFKSKDKVLVAHPQKLANLRLTDILLTTHGVNVFHFRELEGNITNDDWEDIISIGE